MSPEGSVGGMVVVVDIAMGIDSDCMDRNTVGSPSARKFKIILTRVVDPGDLFRYCLRSFPCHRYVGPPDQRFLITDVISGGLFVR